MVGSAMLSIYYLYLFYIEFSVNYSILPITLLKSSNTEIRGLSLFYLND